MYYNTTHANKEDLKEYNKKSSSQDLKILDFFKSHPNELCTPFEVHSILFDENTPVDSVKRSLNTLTKGLFIEKTKNMRMGKFGRENHTWKLRVPTGSGQLSLL